MYVDENKYVNKQKFCIFEDIPKRSLFGVDFRQTVPGSNHRRALYVADYHTELDDLSTNNI